MKTTLSEVINNTLGYEYDPNSLYFITVQGSTCSGKSTFSKALRNTLKKLGFLVTILHLDGFYNFIESSKKDSSMFDYDNPATIAWDDAEQAVRDIIDRKKSFFKFKRNQSVARERKEVENNGINVVILEGIYGANVIGRKKFNIKEYDPNNSKKKIEVPFVKNPLFDTIKKYNVDGSIKNPWNNIKMLNIRFRICFDKLREIRVKSDAKYRGEPEEIVVQRLHNWVYDATKKWVLSDNFDFDLEIQHGNFNTTAINELKQELLMLFKSKLDECDEEKCLSLDFRCVNQVNCSGECQKNGTAGLFVPDKSAN